MGRRRRNVVERADGRLVNVARPRGQLFVCATGCCCGRGEDGFAPVADALFHSEWERRRLRNVVHLTIGGCLGPCALANVVLLLFDGQALWFHSIDSDDLVLALYDYIEQMLDRDGVQPPPASLAPRQFTASAWQPRPDGQPVDDRRPRRGRGAGGRPRPSVDGLQAPVDLHGGARSRREEPGVLCGDAGRPIAPAPAPRLASAARRLDDPQRPWALEPEPPPG